MTEATLHKLKILADSAKYDASCSSSGVGRGNAGGKKAGQKAGLGSTAPMGVCHSFTDDGRFFAKVDDEPLVPIQTTSFDEAADALFLIIKNTPILPAPLFAPVVREETVISDM